MTAYLGVWLIEVPPETWSRAARGQGASLQRLLEQIAACGRRMAKGVAVGAQRSELLALAREVAEAGRLLHDGDRDWRVPEEHMPAWAQLLALLARHRAEMAARSLDRQHAPRFLPAVFAPAATQELTAGAYGACDVGTHLEELMALGQEVVGDSGKLLARALTERRQRFEQAAKTGQGLVEWVEPLA